MIQNGPNQKQEKSRDTFFKKTQKLSKKCIIIKIFLNYLVPYMNCSR